MQSWLKTQAASPQAQRAPDTNSRQATLSRPSKSQVGTHPPGGLQAPLTSGPVGDGLPGMGLIIGGVITV